MFFSTTPRPHSLRAIADVTLKPFWLDDPSKPQLAPSLTTSIQTDLAVIGGGFSGLWTALQAKQADPNREVVLLEADEIAIGASGRNGGFCSASLTHGVENGFSRWRDELPTLTRLGAENLDGIEETIKQFNINCDFVRSGEIGVALEDYQIDDLREEVEHANQIGVRAQFLNQEEIRARIHSPAFLAAVREENVAMINPARLAWGLKEACLRLGVRIFEGSPVVGLEERRETLILKTSQGQVEARQTALATNAFPPLLKHLRLYVVPVYDYVLMSEPLSEAQRDAIGWRGREGLSDNANQFHYSQITADGRILWGGYDAVYHRGNRIAPQLENRPATFGLLAEHFFQVFPQLEGLRFTHAWGGVIDTCSRYSVFWGTAYKNKLTYAVGYTGLGVGASRFGARVMLDLLSGEKTERTELRMTKSKPFPFPPEPFRSPIINFTRWSLDQADRNQGRRNLWLKTLDALGLGFDS
ncbi:MAG: FAD-binding oxidoreductase [Anaerolineales bacterium]|nr:FAD-binding oxidoreductase [Anaerolineales bacterium]